MKSSIFRCQALIGMGPMWVLMMKYIILVKRWGEALNLELSKTDIRGGPRAHHVLPVLWHKTAAQQMPSPPPVYLWCDATRHTAVFSHVALCCLKLTLLFSSSVFLLFLFLFLFFDTLKPHFREFTSPPSSWF